MITYDKSQYYIDFSERDNLTNDEKLALENIQTLYRPIERVDYLLEYRTNRKITDDEFETMTGLPYEFD
jgi:hypothetical protein